ncbi:MAG: DUF5050 domain-containing protein, partial [Lachnospiraceae bacterium]|nr:DUF5050 domain-containing protein [Lachnospiraceae bacterium]
MKKRVNKKYAVILFILTAVIVFCFITDKSGRTGIRKTDTGDALEEAFSENASVRGTDDAVILDEGVSEEPYISPLDQTTITYKDGYYYYRSAVHYNYLYRCDESGTNQECVAEQVPRELYAVGEWIYFTNRSQYFRLCR